MKQCIFLLTILLCISCSGNDDTNDIDIDIENNFIQQTEADIINYIEEHNLDAQRSDSGLYYVIHTEGTGAQPNSSSNVTVAYRTYFLDGTPLDESTKIISLELDQFIKGFREGILYFKEGGSGILLVHSDLAFGNLGSWGVPGGAALVFDIELLSVN